MRLRKRVADGWVKLNYRRVKLPTIDFTGFRPKPFTFEMLFGRRFKCAKVYKLLLNDIDINILNKLEC